MKHKLFILILIFVFLLSSLSVSFGLTSYPVPFAKPDSGPTQGYMVLWIQTSEGIIPRLFTWAAVPDGATDIINAPVYMVGSRCIITKTDNTYTFSFESVYISSGDAANMSCSGSINVVFNNGGKRVRYYTKEFNYQYTHEVNNVVGFDFGGNVSFIGFEGIDYRPAEFGTTSIIDSINVLRDNQLNLYTYLGKVLNPILSFVTSIDTTNSDILDLLEEFNGTTLDESTESLPSDSVNDLEETQGDLRSESDVSSDISSLQDSVDFNAFNNSFGVIWNFAERILSSHSMLMILLMLVLSLGVVNLILNRR